jgi:hypothetical protein
VVGAGIGAVLHDVAQTTEFAVEPIGHLNGYREVAITLEEQDRARRALFRRRRRRAELLQLGVARRARVDAALEKAERSLRRPGPPRPVTRWPAGPPRGRQLAARCQRQESPTPASFGCNPSSVLQQWHKPRVGPALGPEGPPLVCEDFQTLPHGLEQSGDRCPVQIGERDKGVVALLAQVRSDRPLARLARRSSLARHSSLTGHSSS